MAWRQDQHSILYREVPPVSLRHCYVQGRSVNEHPWTMAVIASEGATTLVSVADAPTLLAWMRVRSPLRSGARGVGGRSRLVFGG